MSSLPLLVFLTDIVGKNDRGEICHPYANRVGPAKGYFHYRLVPGGHFRPIDENGLRKLIEAGAFDEEGLVRMAPVGSKDTKRNAGLNVREYQGAPRGKRPKA
jgi:hypothetical protein